MDARDQASTLLTRGHAVLVCVGLSAAAGLYFVSLTSSVIHADETPVAVKPQATDDESLSDTASDRVGRASHIADVESIDQLRVEPVGFWDSRFKPKPRSSDKVTQKPGLLYRLRKQTPQDPFLDTEPVEAEPTEDEEDVETEELVPSRPAPVVQPGPKTKRRAVPQNRKRLLQYQSSVESSELPTSVETASKQSDSVVKHGSESNRTVDSIEHEVRVNNALSDADLFAEFEENPANVSTGNSLPAPDAVVSHDDFEETTSSEKEDLASKKPNQQAGKGREPAAEVTADKSSAAATEQDLFELTRTESTVNQNQNLAFEQHPSGAPVTKDDEPHGVKIDREASKTLPTAPTSEPVQHDVQRTHSSSPAETAGRARVDDQLRDSSSAETVGFARIAESNVTQKSQPKTAKVTRAPAPSSVPPVSAKRGVLNHATNIVDEAEVELPLIRPARKLGRAPLPADEHQAVSAPVAALAHSVAESVVETEEEVASPPPKPQIRTPKPRPALPLGVTANRPIEVDPPAGWSAATKTTVRSQVPTTLSPREVKQGRSGRIEVPSVSDDIEETTFPTNLNPPDPDEVHPILEEPITRRDRKQPNDRQVVRVNSNLPAVLESAIFESTPRETVEAAARVSSEAQEPVIIPELASQTQSPWMTWLLIAFGAGFAICRLLFRPANAD